MIVVVDLQGGASLVGALCVSLLTLIVPTPLKRYPDLWAMIMSSTSFAHFAVFYIYFTFYMIDDNGKHDTRDDDVTTQEASYYEAATFDDDTPVRRQLWQKRQHKAKHHDTRRRQQQKKKRQ